jgi:hypothetical protein
MWQTDSVILQTKVETNVLGSIKVVWTTGATVTCDVQDMNKELAYKEYGLVDNVKYKQVFDHTNADWQEGYQVAYDGVQWLVRLVNRNMKKMGASNHTFVILSKVIS